MGELIPPLPPKPIEVRNAQAVMDAFNDYRARTDKRLQALENEILTLKDMVQKQTRAIGLALQQTHGSGSTVPDPNPNDKR